LDSDKSDGLNEDLDNDNFIREKKYSEKQTNVEPELGKEKIGSQSSKIIKYEPMLQNTRNTGNRKNAESPVNTIRNEMKRPDPDKKIAKKYKEQSKSSVGRLAWIIFLLFILALAAWALISNRVAMKEKERKLGDIQLYDSTTYEDVKPSEFVNKIDDSLAIEAEIAAKVDSMSKAEKLGKSKKIVAKIEPKQLVKPATSPADIVKRPVLKKHDVTNVKFPVFVTMEKGDRLTLLSLKYYGNKIFWVYIYVANKNVIPDPNNVSIGIKIRIPAPDPSMINPNDPNCIAKAKVFQTKILSIRKE